MRELLPSIVVVELELLANSRDLHRFIRRMEAVAASPWEETETETHLRRENTALPLDRRSYQHSSRREGRWYSGVTEKVRRYCIAIVLYFLIGTSGPYKAKRKVL